MSKPPEPTVDRSTLIKAQFSTLNTAGVGDQLISSSVQAWILSMMQASLEHRTQSSVSLFVAREYARQRMRATMIDSHPRLLRLTGMSDYRGEESQYSITVHQTGIQDYV